MLPIELDLLRLDKVNHKTIDQIEPKFLINLVGVVLATTVDNLQQGWHREWFLMQNSESSLPAFTGNTPLLGYSWSLGVDANEQASLEPILEQVMALV
jgi:hypothetical protein